MKKQLEGLSDSDIRSYFANEPRFGGVFANDTMPKPERNKAYIINLENEKEGGSHWCSLYNGYYFDPYGEVPTKRISQFVLKYNTVDYQGLSKSSCGYFAIYACLNFINNKSPSSGLVPNKPNYNESVLKRFFY